MAFDITCPLCMKTYPANNVVFRHDTTELTALGKNPADYSSPDLYIQAYNTKHGIEQDRSVPLCVVDPAFVVEQDRTYQGGMITGVRSEAGYVLKNRVCPYCHNKLYANAGRMPMQQMSIIGYTSAGKTTYESAMIYQLTKDGIGCINNTLDEYGQVDDVVERNVHVLMQGDPAKNNGQQVSSSTSWGATKGYHGPYIFALAQGEPFPPFTLAFYDLPGEDFRKDSAKVQRDAPYIGTAKTCLLLVDLKNISEVSVVISAVLSHFGASMKNNGVNMALVLYKADQITEAIDGRFTVPVPQDLRNHAPIDLKKVDADSDAILKFIVSKDYNLQGTYNAVCSELTAERVRFFTAQTFDADGNFAPKGCDVPLLWSFAKQGLYPHV